MDVEKYNASPPARQAALPNICKYTSAYLLRRKHAIVIPRRDVRHYTKNPVP